MSRRIYEGWGEQVAVSGVQEPMENRGRSRSFSPNSIRKRDGAGNNGMSYNISFCLRVGDSYDEKQYSHRPVLNIISVDIHHCYQLLSDL